MSGTGDKKDRLESLYCIFVVAVHRRSVRRDWFVSGCVGVDVPLVSVSLSLPGIVCPSVRLASFFRISLRDLCRRLRTCEVDIRYEVRVL